MPGFKADLFVDKELAREWECTICLCVWRQAVKTLCRHVFCEKCIQEWQDNIKQCPMRCDELGVGRLMSNWVPLPRHEIPHLRMYCVNKDVGCHEVVTLAQFNRHLSTCEKRGEKIDKIYDTLPAKVQRPPGGDRNSPVRRFRARLLYDELPFEEE
jgi:hypothetical protein